MKKQFIIVGIIILLIFIVLSGCFEGYDPIADNDREKIVATWIAISGDMTLNNLKFSPAKPNRIGGEIKINNLYNGTWSISKHGILNFDVGWINETYYMGFTGYYEFSNNYNTLTIGDIYSDAQGNIIRDITTVYIRQ